MATAAAAAEADLAAHAVYYNTSTCPIKDDVAQLAACWRSGSGPLTRQEAGLLLWYHSQQGEDGRAEVLGTNVPATCLDLLDSSTALPADKSTAAGILLSLCADNKGREAVAKGKASGANGSSCCQVLHACLANPETAPRHVAALLASLSSCATSLSVLLRALGGEVPWAMYCRLLDYSHKKAKDHATAIDTATHIQQLVAGREALAADAAAAGVLEALLTAVAAHKSAAAVCAGARCLLALLCLAAPELRDRLGQLPGAVVKVVDLLGPPPAAIITWEQQQLKQTSPLSPHLPATSATAASAASTAAATAAAAAASTASTAADGQDGEERDLLEQQPSSNSRARRKSLRILNVSKAEPAGPPCPTEPSSSPTTMRTKSMLGCAKQSAIKVTPCLRSIPNTPTLRSPPLSTNSTALKWDTPMPSIPARVAAASLLAQLVQLPALREAASDRLAASRLTVLLNSLSQQLLEARGKKGKTAAAASKGAPEAELEPVCCCLQYLVAGDNAECYRVAAAGCLPALALLACDSKSTRLRRAAQAVLAQVALLEEAQQQLPPVDVPEHLNVPEVKMRLKDAEVRLLLLEFPGTGLRALDDVTARARC